MKINMNNKNKIIIGVVLLILIVSGVGYKLYTNNIENKRIQLIKNVKDNQLDTSDVEYVKSDNLIDEATAKIMLDNIAKLELENINTSELNKIKLSQDSIYAKINNEIKVKAVNIDRDLTASINKLKVKNEKENAELTKIKKVIDGEIKLGNTKIITLANINLFRSKSSQNKAIDNLYTMISDRESTKLNSYNETEILAGNFSSLAGFWQNSMNDSFTIDINGNISKEGLTFTGKVQYSSKDKTYMWSVADSAGGGAAVVLYPVGVGFQNLSSDTTKLRIFMGQGLTTNSLSLYTRTN